MKNPASFSRTGILFVFVLGLTLAPLLRAETTGRVYENVPIETIHRGQSRIGKLEIAIRSVKYAKWQKDEPSRLVKFVDKRAKTQRIKAVIGPGGEFWLNDGHHMVAILSKLGWKAVPIYAELDLSGEDPSAYTLEPMPEEFKEPPKKHLKEWREAKDRWVSEHFEAEMIHRKLVFLKSRKGADKPFSTLNKGDTSVLGLEDFPHRSLVWLVEKAFPGKPWATWENSEGGKTEFAEMNAAIELYNEGIKIDPTDPASWTEALIASATYFSKKHSPEHKADCDITYVALQGGFSELLSPITDWSIFAPK